MRVLRSYRKTDVCLCTILFVLTFVLIIKQRLALPSARLRLRDLSYRVATIRTGMRTYQNILRLQFKC